jgi:crossover junction endodeoxyribonuclease RusA
LNHFRFEAKGSPQPKGSTRSFVINGRVVTTSDNPALHTWQKVIRFCAQDWKSGLLPASTPVSIDIIFTLQRPPSVSAGRRPLPIVKPDCDKLARAVLDALSGIVYRDDAQVVDIHARKRYGDTPGIECEVLWP